MTDIKEKFKKSGLGAGLAAANSVAGLGAIGLQKIFSKNSGDADEIPISAIKKRIPELVAEKSKLYGFIGMEACDLHSEGNLICKELDSYFQKMSELEAEIESLEKQKEEKENTAQKNNICECGTKLTKKDKFCPECGKKTDFSTITCTCGTEVGRTQKFCPECGKSIAEIEKRDMNTMASSANFVECICGAKVDASQLMCMECGRRITKG